MPSRSARPVSKAGAKLADAVAEPVAKRSALDDDQVRAAIGAAFFLLSVVYVAGPVKRLISRT